MFLDAFTTLAVSWLFTMGILALVIGRRGPSPPTTLLIVGTVLFSCLVSTGQLFFEHRRLVRLGWRLSPLDALHWMGPSPRWKLQKLVPYDEFRVTPSYRLDQPRVFNLQACIQLREELEKEWARQAKVDRALDRVAENSEEESRNESEGV